MSATTVVQPFCPVWEEEDHFDEHDVELTLWKDFCQKLTPTFQGYFRPITVQESPIATQTRCQVAVMDARTSSGWKIGRLIRYLRKRLHAMKCSGLNNRDRSRSVD